MQYNVLTVTRGAVSSPLWKSLWWIPPAESKQIRIWRAKSTVLKRSVFKAQKQNRHALKQNWTKHTCHLSSLKAMTSSTLSYDIKKHINLHFFFLKISKIAFILWFEKFKIFLKNYNSSQIYRDCKVAWSLKIALQNT